MSLGHPSYLRPKGTGSHSMEEKRGYVEIGETGPRKTRVASSKLDRLNPKSRSRLELLRRETD